MIVPNNIKYLNFKYLILVCAVAGYFKQGFKQTGSLYANMVNGRQLSTGVIWKERSRRCRIRYYAVF